MIDALIKRVSVTYKCYEKYVHRGKKVQLLVFELTMLVVIGTDCTGSCKSNYHMITTRTALVIMIKITIMCAAFSNISWMIAK
jgi:hypothetical protein